jgi:hypothetical protein
LIRALTGGAGRHGDLAVRGGESQHLDIDVPDAGREIQRIAAIFVGVGDHLRFALPRRDLGAGDELVGGAHGPALLGRMEGPSSDEHDDDQNDEQK